MTIDDRAPTDPSRADTGCSYYCRRCTLHGRETPLDGADNALSRPSHASSEGSRRVRAVVKSKPDLGFHLLVLHICTAYLHAEFMPMLPHAGGRILERKSQI
jgi:hypothetical protein